MELSSIATTLYIFGLVWDIYLNFRRSFGWTWESSLRVLYLGVPCKVRDPLPRLSHVLNTHLATWVLFGRRLILVFCVLFTVYPRTVSQIIQQVAQFCLNSYLCLFSTCFGHPSAHHQAINTVSIQHWYLSLCKCGVWSAGWFSIQPADQTPPIQSDKYQCRIDTVIFSW